MGDDAGAQMHPRSNSNVTLPLQLPWPWDLYHRPARRAHPTQAHPPLSRPALARPALVRPALVRPAAATPPRPAAAGCPGSLTSAAAWPRLLSFVQRALVSAERQCPCVSDGLGPKDFMVAS